MNQSNSITTVGMSCPSIGLANPGTFPTAYEQL
jgi:hypothetical protein